MMTELESEISKALVEARPLPNRCVNLLFLPQGSASGPFHLHQRPLLISSGTLATEIMLKLVVGGGGGSLITVCK